MSKRKVEGKRIFVLDTNVLMHDPSALFHFAEHDIYLPMMVLEELDGGKKGVSETSRNARQTSRYIAALMARNESNMMNGLELIHPDILEPTEQTSRPVGHLFFQTEPTPPNAVAHFTNRSADNELLSYALHLTDKFPERDVTVVSKDINLRIKAAILDIPAEDYYNDQALDDLALMYPGVEVLPDDFWSTHAKIKDSWQENGRTFYKISGPNIKKWGPNYCIHIDNENEKFEAIVQKVEGDTAFIEYAADYRRPKNQVINIMARNTEQNFALNLLMNPEIDLVTLVGTAGTGKTLLTLAAALAQTLKEKRYREIIVTRVTIPLGEDIGFLPGTEVDKMTPWMGAIMDNLEVLYPESVLTTQEESMDFLQRNHIKIRSMNFMRGRTFLNKFIIIDEAQNLTPKQMRALITRAGPGTKIVCLGNVSQIDTPYLTETTSGLTYLVQQFQKWSHSGHLILSRSERSRLADHAAEVL
ncbi:MAG: PhoH family protein [Pseudomonadota bacterium]